MRRHDLMRWILFVSALVIGSGSFGVLTAQKIAPGDPAVDPAKIDRVEGRSVDSPPRDSSPETPPPGKPSAGKPLRREGNEKPPATAPLDDIPSFGEALTRMVIVLACIAGCLFLVYRILLRWSGQRAFFGRGKVIEVIDTTSIGPRKTLHLVRLAGEYFLVGSTDSRLELLAGGRIPKEKLTEMLGARDLDGRDESAPSGGGFHQKLSPDA